MSELVVDKQLIFDEIWKLRRNQQLRDDSHDADRVMQGIYLVEKAIEQLPSTDLIRCKDCKHRQDPIICPMTFEEYVEIDEGDGCYDSDYILHDNTIDDGFCDRGDSE